MVRRIIDEEQKLLAQESAGEANTRTEVRRNMKVVKPTEPPIQNIPTAV
jgi:hypothetical protein